MPTSERKQEPTVQYFRYSVEIHQKHISFHYLQDFDQDLDVDPGDTQRETTHGWEHDEKHHREHPKLENTNSQTPQVVHHRWQLRQPQQFNRGHVIIYNRDKGQQNHS